MKLQRRVGRAADRRRRKEPQNKLNTMSRPILLLSSNEKKKNILNASFSVQNRKLSIIQYN